MIQYYFSRNHPSTILFDAEGVLFRKIRSDEENVSQILGISISKYNDTLVHIRDEHVDFLNKNQLIPTIEHEELFLTQLHKLLCKYLNIVPEKSLIQSMNDARMRSDYEIFPDVESGLSRLQKKYYLTVLTNSFPSRRFHELKPDGLGKYFKKIYIAYELGFKKPDVRIYDYIINDLHIQRDEIIFIDNKLSNIKGALKSGILNVISFSPHQLSSNITSVVSFKELINILV